MMSAFVGTLKFAATGMRKPHDPLHRPAQNPLHKNISVLNCTGQAFIPRTKSLVPLNRRIQTRSNSQLAKPSNQNKPKRFILTPVRIGLVVLIGVMGYRFVKENHRREMEALNLKREIHAKVYGDQ